MAKKFNIHDWQAKQRQQLLTENDRFPGEDEAGMAPRHNDLESEISRYIGGTFASWMSPDYPAFAQEFAKPPYFDKLVRGIMDIVNNQDVTSGGGINEGDKGENEMNDFIKSVEKSPNKEEIFKKFEDVIESFAPELWKNVFAKFDKGNEDMWTPTSTADIPQDTEKAPKAKQNWRDYRENTTGTGASVGAGAGEAFASPNAFKKKRK